MRAGADLYATLRREGRLRLSQAEATKIGNLRRLARLDNLVVVAGLPSGAGLTADQRRLRPYSVTLHRLADRATIYAPDAPVSSADVDLPDPHIVNAATGSVHTARCKIGKRSAYAAPWRPDDRDPLDTAHPACLPGGLPD